MDTKTLAGRWTGLKPRKLTGMIGEITRHPNGAMKRPYLGFFGWYLNYTSFLFCVRNLYTGNLIRQVGVPLVRNGALLTSRLFPSAKYYYSDIDALILEYFRCVTNQKIWPDKPSIPTLQSKFREYQEDLYKPQDSLYSEKITFVMSYMPFGILDYHLETGMINSKMRRTKSYLASDRGYFLPVTHHAVLENSILLPYGPWQIVDYVQPKKTSLIVLQLPYQRRISPDSLEPWNEQDNLHLLDYFASRYPTMCFLGKWQPDLVDFGRQHGFSMARMRPYSPSFFEPQQVIAWRNATGYLPRADWILEEL